MSSELTTTPATLTETDLDAYDGGDEWDAYFDGLRRASERLLDIVDQAENIDWHLNRDEEVQVDDLLALYDLTNILVATTLADRFVIDDTGAVVTFEDWHNLTNPSFVDWPQPAVSTDEIVVSAAEYDRDIDAAYDAGADDAGSCTPTEPDALGPFYKPGAPVRASVGRGYVLEGAVQARRGAALRSKARPSSSGLPGRTADMATPIAQRSLPTGTAPTGSRAMSRRPTMACRGTFISGSRPGDSTPW